MQDGPDNQGGSLNRTGWPGMRASGSRRASNGGAVAAALEAFETKRNAGSLSSGLHHATRALGSGFCTFNGLALAARAVIDAGAKRVLVVDSTRMAAAD